MRVLSLASLACAAFLLGATAPLSSQVVTHTIDTSEEWVFLDLDAPTQPIPIDQPAASHDWDIAFQGTEVMINGGRSGPAGLTAYCVCQNALSPPAVLQGLTADSELAAFQSVRATDLPPAAEWSPSAMAETRWYRYNLRGDDHLIWPTYDVYLVRRGDVVYKLQIIGYYGPSAEPRQLTFRTEKLTG